MTETLLYTTCSFKFCSVLAVSYKSYCTHFVTFDTLLKDQHPRGLIKGAFPNGQNIDDRRYRPQQVYQEGHEKGLEEITGREITTTKQYSRERQQQWFVVQRAVHALPTKATMKGKRWEKSEREERVSCTASKFVRARPACVHSLPAYSIS